MNQELEFLEPLLTCADGSSQWVDTSDPNVKAAVLRTSKGILVLPMWLGSSAQFVPGQAAVAKLSMVVPQVPPCYQVWEVTPGEVRSIKPVTPPKSNRKSKRDCDFALYRERNLVEQFFNIIKHFRAIATR